MSRKSDQGINISIINFSTLSKFLSSPGNNLLRLIWQCGELKCSSSQPKFYLFRLIVK